MAFYSPPQGPNNPNPNRQVSKTEDTNSLYSQAQEIYDQAVSLRDEYVKKLESVTKISKEQAKEELISQSEKIYAQDLAKLIQKTREDYQGRADEIAQELIISAMQHGATTYTAEYTVSVVTLPNEAVKGAIIGRDGKNIAAFEKATGVEIEIEEGNSVRLSSFDSFRREVARRSLEYLIKDSRLTPTRIEEIVANTKSQLDHILMDEGRKICSECGVFDLNPELVKMIGKYRFRFSYGQNLGIHTIEETKIGVQIAKELNLSPEMIYAVRLGCLLHDIGKVVTDEEGTHVQLGVQLLKKFDFPDLIVNAVAEHHEDKPFSSSVSRIVWIADAVSGSRPGARYESHDGYVKRLKQIEDVGKSFKEVSEVYAFQAGRDVRVIVKPELASDSELSVLVSKIRTKLEKDAQYVGQIRITAIRETRASDITKAK